MHKTLFSKLLLYNPKYNKLIFTPVHLHDPTNFYTKSYKRTIILDDMQGDFVFSHVNIGTRENINFIYTSNLLLKNDENIVEEIYVFGFRTRIINPYTSYYHKLTMNGKDIKL